MYSQRISKSQFYRQLRQLLNIREHYNSIALDCNNLLGRALHRLEQIATDLMLAVISGYLFIKMLYCLSNLNIKVLNLDISYTCYNKMQAESQENQVYHTLSKMYRPFRQQKQLKDLQYRKIGIDGTSLLLNMEDKNMMGVLAHIKTLRQKDIYGQKAIEQIVRFNFPNLVVNSFIEKLQPLIRKYTYSKISKPKITNSQRINPKHYKCFVVFDGLTLDKRKKNQLDWTKANSDKWCQFLMTNQIVRQQDETWIDNEQDYTYARPQKDLIQRLRHPDHIYRQLTKSKQYWAIFNQILSTIMHILENLQIFVVKAPYEADAQLIKLYKQGYIECVVSYDHGFINYEIPLVLAGGDLRQVFIIDFLALDPQEIQDALLRKWVQETQSNEQKYSIAENNQRLMKRMALEVLRGSKYIERFGGLQLPDIMRAILLCDQIEQDLSSFFRLIREFGQIKIPIDYQDDAFEVMLIFLYQTCASKKNEKRLEYLDQQYNQLLNQRFVPMCENKSPHLYRQLLQLFKQLATEVSITQINSPNEEVQTNLHVEDNPPVKEAHTQNVQQHLENIFVNIESDQDDNSSDEDMYFDPESVRQSLYFKKSYKHVAHQHLSKLVGAHFKYTELHFFGYEDPYNHMPRAPKPDLKQRNNFNNRLRHITHKDSWITKEDIIKNYYLNKRQSEKQEQPQVKKGRQIMTSQFTGYRQPRRK